MTAILLIGLGRMGGALMSGWGAAGEGPLYFIDRKTTSWPGAVKLATAADIAALPPPLVVVLAVKPAAGAAVLETLAPWLTGEDLVISVMAGVRLEMLRRAAGPGVAIIRAMPNIAFAVGRSATAAVAGPDLSPASRSIGERVLGAGGGLTWLATEQALDAATAIAGSGLAYLFAFTEHLARAGAELGLPSSSAMALARDVLAGAGAMATGDEPLAALRQRITSPGGTTAAALTVFDHDDGLGRLVANAARAAASRSAQISTDTLPATERSSPCP